MCGPRALPTCVCMAVRNNRSRFEASRKDMDLGPETSIPCRKEIPSTALMANEVSSAHCSWPVADSL